MHAESVITGEVRARPAVARSLHEANEATPFARHAGTDRWHFHLECSSYPAGSRVERQATVPSAGVLCRECRRHSRRRAPAD